MAFDKNPKLRDQGPCSCHLGAPVVGTNNLVQLQYPYLRWFDEHGHVIQSGNDIFYLLENFKESV